MLIAFTAYLFEPGFNPESHHQASLAHWMKRRPELYRLALLPAVSITSSHTSAVGMYMGVCIVVCMKFRHHKSVFMHVAAQTAMYTKRSYEINHLNSNIVF